MNLRAQVVANLHIATDALRDELIKRWNIKPEELSMKMWVTVYNGGVYVIKEKTAELALKKFAEAFHDPREAKQCKFELLTIELLDKITSEGEFADADGEFGIVPGADC